jgi:dTDP-4-amino-4,6-dideoxygalactose transaminase
LQMYLKRKGIETIVYFPYPMHKMPIFAEQFNDEEFPNSDLAASSCLSLPLYPELGEPEIEYITKTILEFYETTMKRCE